jgi:hypothetical protein
MAVHLPNHGIACVGDMIFGLPQDDETASVITIAS